MLPTDWHVYACITIAWQTYNPRLTDAALVSFYILSTEALHVLFYNGTVYVICCFYILMTEKHMQQVL